MAEIKRVRLFRTLGDALLGIGVEVATAVLILLFGLILSTIIIEVFR